LAPKRIVVLGQTRAIGAGVATALQSYTTGSVTRIGGADRYETAALLATASHPEGARTAYLASGEVFADALSGGPSAILADAPMLLTQADRVPATTLAALRTLGVTKVVVLGGPGAISAAAAARVGGALGAAGTITRIAGPDRYATSAAVAEYTFPGIATKPRCSTVYVAAGETFADALSGGPVASTVPAPMLLTAGNVLASPTAHEIGTYAARRAVVLGGTGAFTTGTEAQVRDLLGR
jgi:putative cell wall-binding protein